jgi:alcohol dehydrogenase, propanol-preferring
MPAARMYGYKQPLVLQEVEIPQISSTQILVGVGGAGMCRSDVQLVDGCFAEAIKPKSPITRGDEIAGLVEAIEGSVPETAHLH